MGGSGAPQGGESGGGGGAGGVGLLGGGVEVHCCIASCGSNIHSIDVFVSDDAPIFYAAGTSSFFWSLGFT